MIAEGREMVMDIVREMRRCAGYSSKRKNCPSISIATWNHLADRIEAAYKRECGTWEKMVRLSMYLYEHGKRASERAGGKDNGRVKVETKGGNNGRSRNARVSRS